MYSMTGIFVYGSLLNPVSASRTLGRSVKTYTPICLPGSRLAWSSAQKVFMVESGKELVACSLNVELGAAVDSCTQGALLGVSTEEIANLLIRENGYSLINITDRIPNAEFSRVYTFTDLRSKPSEEIVMEDYLKRVLEGVRAQGNNFESAYLRQLPVPNLKIKGAFVFADKEHQRLV